MKKSSRQPSAVSPQPEVPEMRRRYRLALVVEEVDEHLCADGEWEEDGGARLVELDLLTMDSRKEVEEHYGDARDVLDADFPLVIDDDAERRWPSGEWAP